MKQLTLVRVITDAGVSGGKSLASRKGGAALLDAIRRREAGAVVMFKLDRMFRNAGDCLTTVEGWERAGVALHVVDLGGNAIDTTSAAGRFMLTVLAGAAEMERNLVRERATAALAVKRANGQRVGTIPYQPVEKLLDTHGMIVATELGIREDGLWHWGDEAASSRTNGWRRAIFRSRPAIRSM